jgi:hypothetical protein
VNRRLLAGLAAATAVSLTLPAVAAPRADTTRIDLLTESVVYGDLGPARGDAKAVAARALAAYDDRLGVDAARFRFDSVRHSLIGTHVRGSEQRGGVPVAGTDALVTIADGRVVQVAAHGAGDVTGTAVASPVGAATALTHALAAAHARTTLVPSTVTRVLVPTAGRLVDTYRVTVLSTKVAATYDVSAATGRVLGVRDERKFVDGKATAFDPNPIQSSRNGKLREPGVDTAGVDTDLPSAELDKTMKTLPLKGLEATALLAGKLTGPWADVVGPTLPASLTGEFAFKRHEPGFETTMAYAHVDRIQRYFQSLGFSPKREMGVNDEPQNLVTVRVETYDNSFYQPGNDVIVYGTGGVDDAEDAEVIVHEYGHAVQDAQVPGWGSGHEGGAMGEGFGDFLAGAYFARTSGGYGDVCIADWDATSYSTGKPPCLRRMDSTKKYPKDMTSQNEKADSVHADGELWSSYLWRLRSYLGTSAVQRSDNVIKLVLTSHELLTPQADFADAIAALRAAAKRLKQPAWAKYVDAAAKATTMPYKG